MEPLASRTNKKFIEKDPESPSNLCNASIYMIEMDLLRALDSLRTEVSLAALAAHARR